MNNSKYLEQVARRKKIHLINDVEWGTEIPNLKEIMKTLDTLGLSYFVKEEYCSKNEISVFKPGGERSVSFTFGKDRYGQVKVYITNIGLPNRPVSFYEKTEFWDEIMFLLNSKKE